ncbi:uncharacterized protein LOC142986969 [Anticarsia gemmatalis]|uniref:uncharacterized protein LOC142985088 n=1 Tax=Anticarsia gemmatalis TaxID=129554 RepID=UPI003F76EFEA
MPTTRSEGKGRKTTAQTPSSSEGTASTSATGATTEATGTSVTGTTDNTENTAATTSVTATTAPSGRASAPLAPPTDETPSVTASTAPTLRMDAACMQPPGGRTDPLPNRNKETTKPGETVTVQRKVNISVQPNKPQCPSPPPVLRAQGGSTASRVKAIKIAKAREELLRLQVELATARLAVLETEDSDEEQEEISVCTKEEVNERVDSWLERQNTQPILAITNEPHQPEEPSVIRTTMQGDQHQSHGTLTPAGARQDFKELAEAITSAVRAGQRPKFIELPIFNGSYQDWLPFRAAYYETESVYSTVENINRLRRNLKGKAREAVEGLLITDAHPSEIMQALESRFGRPESIAMMQMEALRVLPRLTESPRDICIFATKISNIVATLKTLSCINYMYNPEVSKTIVDKLTPTLRYRFFDFAAAEPKEDPDLMKLDKFLRRESTLCSPYALPEQISTQPPFTAQKRPQRVHNVTEKPYTPRCPVCEQTGHLVTECGRFKKMNEDERWDIAKAKRLCFRCLRYRKVTHRCATKQCGVNDCKYTHHTLLHCNKKEDKKESEASEIITSTWTPRKKQSFLKIIPVQVEGSTGQINTFALMDDGSTVTLIDNDLAKQIGATGPVDPLKIQTISDVKTSEIASRRVTFSIRGMNGFEDRIQARTVRNFQVSSQRVSREHIKACQHLKDIQGELTYEDVKPKLLIGQDNWHLLLTSDIRKGNKDQPVASLTSLGWVLHGSLLKHKTQSIDFVSHMTETNEDHIETLVKQYFEMDAICLNPKRPRSDPEEQALRILDNTTKKTEDGRYETSLLWRKEDYNLPNNYENSLKRLHNIEKKIDRDQVLKTKYKEQMEALVQKGYAEPAPRETTPGKTWYLPHFAVINPMKPEKLRVVHDAAAKTKGVSLNDMLLKGPDLLQSLPGVVMKFRQHAIAVTADIKEMFMQVQLRVQDRDALRYLWRGDRRDDNPPEEYRMKSLIFGASSSPSTAIYVKNLNAKQYEVSNPEAALAIKNKHYVDDYLDSFETLEDAIRITKDVRQIHQNASFELKQWKSNSPSLLAALGEQEQREDLELYTSTETTERVLGVIWKITTDELTFNLNLARIEPPLLKRKTPTKREALKIVMSLFDPLGLASPVTIKAKQILQEVWRRGTGWDAEIQEDLAEEWKIWMEHLQRLRDVTIPRRYLGYSDATKLQLHVFTDASESAYSAVLYWRTETPNGDVAVSLIMAKAKVAPLKLTSIPRLELQAAVMGTRIAETVIEEHEKKPDKRVFWTDSRTVLTWIRTGSRSYKPFVAHRLAAIEESTKVNEWRWIPTKMNVADDATRDVPVAFDKHHRWYKGPDFLLTDEELWPTEKHNEKTEDSTEEKVHLTRHKEDLKLSQGLPDVSRFSDWNRLRYTTARVLQFIQLCRNRTDNVNYKRTIRNTVKDPNWNQTTKREVVKKATSLRSYDKIIPVTAETLKKAEELLMCASQVEAFATDIEDLKDNKPINKESRLHHLSVELTNDVIRLRSRIDAIGATNEAIKSPMVLDGNHPTVKLWVNSVHRQLHHAGVEATVNECRQQYWVIRIRPVTRAILKRCLFCRMKTQVPPHPRTGDLPACRLAHHRRPFTYTGVDYFGPLSVAVGRTRQKRYVAIFTCLTTRAVHLEIAGSLTTDSAIMALRRMIARRGCPTEIWSDNGTNLKGADKELRQAIDAGTSQEAAKRTISWRYIPPGAPFMGGAWERLVRSVKVALTATLHERNPTEEVLSTLLSEAEYTVNSRPLTHVSVSAEDPEALTPNHFLLGGPGRVPQPGTFTERDELSTSKWRAAQRLADVFWTRWLREYLPELQNRREPHGRGPAVRVDDLVQVVDPNLPRNIWLRGRVTAVYPGPDNVVRTVDILTKGGVLRRPVRKLVILPLRGDDAPAPTEDATTSHGGRDVRGGATEHDT